MVKNYDLSIKTLNLLHNPISQSLLDELRKFMDNQYDSSVITPKNKSHPKLKPPELKKRMQGYDDDLDIKTREQIKLDKFVEEGNRFNHEKEFDDPVILANELEKSLKKEYESIKTNHNENRRSSEESITEHLDQVLEDTETLIPVGDMRFNRHTVLPFNLRK